MSKEKIKNDKRKYCPNQYAMLKRCSERKDTTEWNQWRRQNPEQDVHLDEANLEGFFLKNALLTKGHIGEFGSDTGMRFEGEVYLRKAFFRKCRFGKCKI